MKRLILPLLLASACLVPLLSQKSASPFTGRWDLTFTTPASTYPGWLELTPDGKARFQPRGGTVFPVTDVQVDGTKLTVTPWKGVSIVFTPKSANELSGEQKRGDQTEARVVALRAPALKRPMPKAWSKPEAIFNGKDMTGWEPDSKTVANHWVARDGVLLNEAKGANIMTTRKFEDFQLHIEFNCPLNGNSGVYLRGRDEIQVEYEEQLEDAYHMMGSIYGFLAPTAQFPRKPGTWESFDATLVGRTLTLFRNGIKIIDRQEIPGISGGALDSREGEPGPIYIQGDHTGGMMYRNITIALPKK
jgi:hypothetical protein